MKKIISIMMACGLALIAAAQDNSKSVANVDTSLFKANEFSVSAVNSIVLNDDHKFALSVGGSYSITKNLLGEGQLPLYQTKGVSVDRLALGLAYRYPVTATIAPTARAGMIYNWDRNHTSAYIGAAVEIKLNRQWGVLPGFNYEFDDVRHGQFVPQVALRYTF